MKTLLSFLFFLIAINVFAQKHPFIRVFTYINGSKTVRGKLTAITDSSIIVKGKTISYHDIYLIRTKRSFGNSLWTYSLSGLACGLTCGTISAINTGGAHAWIGSFVGFLLGTPIGIITGTTIGATKNTKEIYVQGDLNTWLSSKAFLEDKMK